MGVECSINLVGASVGQFWDYLDWLIPQYQRSLTVIAATFLVVWILKKQIKNLDFASVTGILSEPIIEKKVEHGGGNSMQYAVAEMQGWRTTMEDAHCAEIGLPAPFEKWTFFGVFDGHRGRGIAQHAADNLLNTILQTSSFQTLKARMTCSESSPMSVSPEEEPELVIQGIQTGFLRLDKVMRALPEVASGKDKSGSTAVGLMISPNYHYLINCGDSRTFVVRAGEILAATDDHKPTNQAEKERIERAGGSVFSERVCGILALSRALGDYDFKTSKLPAKEQMVSPEPDVQAVLSASDDEFAVIACDGIFDVMKNEELCQFIRSRLLLTDDLEDICAQVLDTCLHKGSTDNLTCLIIALSSLPKVSEEAVRKEKELDQKLENLVKDCFQQSKATNLETILFKINANRADIDPLLPPGGGLQAKWTFIEETFLYFMGSSDDEDNAEANEEKRSEIRDDASDESDDDTQAQQ